jgi:hypothetical protein
MPASPVSVSLPSRPRTRSPNSVPAILSAALVPVMTLTHCGGTSATVTCCVDEAVAPQLFVARSVTPKVPAAKRCWTLAPDAVPPSPNSHA